MLRLQDPLASAATRVRSKSRATVVFDGRCDDKHGHCGLHIRAAKLERLERASARTEVATPSPGNSVTPSPGDGVACADFGSGIWQRAPEAISSDRPFAHGAIGGVTRGRSSRHCRRRRERTLQRRTRLAPGSTEPGTRGVGHRTPRGRQLHSGSAPRRTGNTCPSARATRVFAAAQATQLRGGKGPKAPRRRVGGHTWPTHPRGWRHAPQHRPTSNTRHS